MVVRAPPGFEIHEELGRGAMGVVYRARQIDLDRDVALKVLISETGEQLPQNALKRFRIEADIQAKLDHPNVVRIYICDVEGPIPCLVFELVEGARTLHDLLVKGFGQLSLQERLAMGDRIVSAAAYMHERSIIHRDLKPQNILIDVRYHVKVADFGIGRDLLSSATRVTEMVKVPGRGEEVGWIGTPAYMSPEQLRGEQATFESDVYTLGMILYELLVGHLVFSGNAPYVTPLQRSKGRIRPIQEFDPEIPDELAASIARCFAQDPAARPSASDLWGEITAMVDTVSTEDRGDRPSGNTVVSAAPRPRRTQQEVPPDGAVNAARAQRPRRLTRPGVTVAVPPPITVAPPTAPISIRPRLWWIAITAVAVGSGFVVTGARVEHAARQPSAGSSANAPSAATLADRLVAKASSLKHDDIGLPWLERFAKRQRSSLAACATKDAAAAREIALGIRANLEDLAVLAPLNEFLAVAEAYFVDSSIPEEARWATRTALINIELLERFSIEHRASWSSVAIGSLVKAVDAAFGPVIDPSTIDLRRAQNWLRGPLATPDRYFPGETRLIHWRLPDLPPSERPLLWFGTLRWPSGHLLDVTVNGRFRTLLHMRTPSGDTPPIPVNATEIIEPAGRRSNPAHLVEAGSTEASERSFTAIWLPPPVISARTEVSITIIDLPGTARAARNPALIERVISFVSR